MGKGNHKETIKRLEAKIKNIDEKYKRFDEQIKLSKSSQSKYSQPATVENHTINGVRYF